MCGAFLIRHQSKNVLSILTAESRAVSRQVQARSAHVTLSKKLSGVVKPPRTLFNVEDRLMQALQLTTVSNS